MGRRGRSRCWPALAASALPPRASPSPTAAPAGCFHGTMTGNAGGCIDLDVILLGGSARYRDRLLEAGSHECAVRGELQLQPQDGAQVSISTGYRKGLCVWRGTPELPLDTYPISQAALRMPAGWPPSAECEWVSRIGDWHDLTFPGPGTSNTPVYVKGNPDETRLWRLFINAADFGDSGFASINYASSGCPTQLVKGDYDPFQLADGAPRISVHVPPIPSTVAPSTRPSSGPSTHATSTSPSTWAPSSGPAALALVASKEPPPPALVGTSTTTVAALCGAVLAAAAGAWTWRQRRRSYHRALRGDAHDDPGVALDDECADDRGASDDGTFDTLSTAAEGSANA